MTTLIVALCFQVDVDIATHIDVYDDGPDRRYEHFTLYVISRDKLVC